MSLMQSEQETFQIRILKDDLKLCLGCLGLGVTSRLHVLCIPITVQQCQTVTDLLSVEMSRQVTNGFFNDGYGVASASRRDVQMQVQALFIATELKEPSKGPIAPTLDPDQDDSPGFNRPASGHRLSADFRETAEHPGPVLGIKTGIATKAAHVLGAVYLGCTVAILLHDEDLLFLQVVE